MTWLLILITMLIPLPVVVTATGLAINAHRHTQEFRRMSTDELHVLSRRS